MSRALCAGVLFATFVSRSPASAGEAFPDGVRYLSISCLDDASLGGLTHDEAKSILGSWKNKLGVTQAEITLGFRNNRLPAVQIPTSAISRITYGQERRRHVAGRGTTAVAGTLGLLTFTDPDADHVAGALILGPIVAFQLAHRSRQHYLAVEYVDEDGWNQVLRMQLHRKRFRGVLNALGRHTGKPVLASLEDRDWLVNQGVNVELDEVARSSRQ